MDSNTRHDYGTAIAVVSGVRNVLKVEGNVDSSPKVYTKLLGSRFAKPMRMNPPVKSFRILTQTILQGTIASSSSE